MPSGPIAVRFMAMGPVRPRFAPEIDPGRWHRRPAWLAPCVKRGPTASTAHRLRRSASPDDAGDRFRREHQEVLGERDANTPGVEQGAERRLVGERPVAVAGGVAFRRGEPLPGEIARRDRLHLETEGDGGAAGEGVGQEAAGHLTALHQLAGPGLDLGAARGGEQDGPAASGEAVVERLAGGTERAADETEARL